MTSQSYKPTLPSLTVNVPAEIHDGGPKSAIGMRRVALQPKTRITLQELWWKAEQEFNKDNPKHKLGVQFLNDKQGVQIAKDGVFQRWQHHYQPDNSDDAKRKEKLTKHMSNVLSALELVGSFASQAAACAFPPAGLCFSALQFLIEAPKHIQKVYEDLERLFVQVDRFLMQFSIYQRMDDKFGLDESLITNANKLLVQFVRICGLSIKLLEGGKWQTFKQGFKTVIFADDSGVQAELDSFESLAKFNNELTDTITLEHVLQSEENTNQILRDNNELLSSVGQILANSNDEKTRLANKDQVREIKKKLFGRNPPLEEEMSAGIFQDDLVPNTFETIQSSKEYQTWNEDDTNTILVIHGCRGSGKSRLMDAIKQHLDGLRNSASRDLHSIYVASFNFSEKTSKIAGKKKSGKSLVPHALRIISLQVAEQSTTYAKDLCLQLGTNKIKTDDSDKESTWKSLRLGNLDISPTPRLYILLDAVDEERTDAQDLIATFTGMRETSALRVKILVTTTEADDKAGFFDRKASLKLSAETVKATLLPSFVRGKMIELGIFQDSDKASRRLRQNIFNGITQSQGMTFGKAAEKLDMIRNAIEQSAPRSIITDILEEKSTGSSAKEGQAILQRFEKTLHAGDLKLLSSILMWLMAIEGRCLPLEALEAALRLEQADLPIETLAKKIKNTFDKAIAWRSSEFVELDPSIESFLSERHELTQLKGSEPLITLNISIRDATPSTVTEFVWDLHENLVNGRFDFGIGNAKPRKIQTSKLTTHMTVTRLCFKLLSEGWNDDTKMMLRYAQSEIPRQLILLKEMEASLTRGDRRVIGEGLVSFLRDPHAFEERHEEYADTNWMSDELKIDAVRFWLMDKETVKQLPIKEQRWVKAVLDVENGKLGFLCDLAHSISRRWLTDRKSPARELSDWVYNYSRALTVSREQQKHEDDIENGVANDAEKANQDEYLESAKGLTGAKELNIEEFTASESHSIVTESQETDVEQQIKANGPILEGGQSQQQNTVTGPARSDPAMIDKSESIDGAAGDSLQPELHETNLDGGPTAIVVNGGPIPDESNFSLSRPEEPPSTTLLTTDDPEDVIPEYEKEMSAEYEKAMSEALNAATRFFQPQEDTVYLYNLGCTCFNDGQATLALRYFNKALEMARSQEQNKNEVMIAHILRRQAHCKKALDNSDASLKLVSESLAIFKQLKSNGELIDDYDESCYIAELKDWALSFEEKIPNQALEWYETALDLAKTDEEKLKCRWAVLKLQCQVETSQERALRFLDDWLRDYGKSDNLSPSTSLLEMVEDYDGYQVLMQICCSVRNEQLRTTILAICAQALAAAGKEHTGVYGHLFRLQATACVNSVVLKIKDKALGFYENALSGFVSDPEADSYWFQIASVVTCILKCKLDVHLSKISANSLISIEDRMKQKMQLERDFESMIALDADLRHDRGVDSAAAFIISFYSLYGMIDEVRNYWKSEMADALEMLSDSDPENDREGVKKLARIFCFMGDQSRLLTAFSLLDRQLNLDRNKTDGQRKESVPLLKKIEGGWFHGCDSCGNNLFSSDDEGMWWCRYCPNVDLCSSCKAKHDTGHLSMVKCSCSHASAFIHLAHTDYTLEELESGNDDTKIMIDWTYEPYADARGGYIRKGGRIVTLRSWVEYLSKEWNLPEPKGDVSRAQK